MNKRNTGNVSPAIANNWQPVEEWDGFTKGDLVHVSGTHGSEFRFMYAVVREGVVTEVTVYGGVNGHGQFRTFLPNRVTRPSVAKRRRVRSEAVA